MSKKQGFETSYGYATVEYGVYGNGKIAVVLEGGHGERIAVLSVNLTDKEYEEYAPTDDEFFAKTWGDNVVLVEPLLKTGIFIDTGKRVPVGYVVAQVWRITNSQAQEKVG